MVQSAGKLKRLSQKVMPLSRSRLQEPFHCCNQSAETRKRRQVEWMKRWGLNLCNGRQTVIGCEGGNKGVVVCTHAEMKVSWKYLNG